MLTDAWSDIESALFNNNGSDGNVNDKIGFSLSQPCLRGLPQGTAVDVVMVPDGQHSRDLPYALVIRSNSRTFLGLGSAKRSHLTARGWPAPEPGGAIYQARFRLHQPATLTTEATRWLFVSPPAQHLTVDDDIEICVMVHGFGRRFPSETEARRWLKVYRTVFAEYRAGTDAHVLEWITSSIYDHLDELSRI